MATHTLVYQKSTDPGLENFYHRPNLLHADTYTKTKRHARSRERRRYIGHNGTVAGALRAILYSELRPATIFNSKRIICLVLGHILIATLLCLVYYIVPISASIQQKFLPGIKDFADLCVTGIVFLLGGFVATMLTRWWAVRSQCCGALHQSLHNLNTLAAAVWPKDDKVDREAREVVTRYSVAAYQLLFLEARAGDLELENEDGVEQAVRHLLNGTLTQAELQVLAGMPSKATIVVGWLAAFFEKAMDPKSGLACSSRLCRNSDNGRYGVIFGQIFHAHNAITLCYQYLQSQLPYGYIHLILLTVQLTSLANTIYCGIHLGQTIQDFVNNGEGVPILAPLIFVRIMRICFIPLLLDGMLFIGHVIALPLGNDCDDFPAGAFLESLEEDCMACGAANEQFHPATVPWTKLSLTPKETRA